MLIGRATSSIDVQTYLVKNDLVGRVFGHVLLQAADRGVQVRVLLDDMFLSGMDPVLLALDSHVNVSVRVFNPFRRHVLGRNVGALFEAGRLNRRMHNKSFTVDGHATIVGGRNIADEYFGAREDANFGDLDVLAYGPIVAEVSDSFNAYWEHECAAPVGTFIPKKAGRDKDLHKLQERLGAFTSSVIDTAYAGAINRRIGEFADMGADDLRTVPYRLLVDSPDKGVRRKAGSAGSIMTPIRESLMTARSEVLIVSPYFVPRRSGMEELSAISARGVRVRIVTNSLAANNQFLVHGGYAPSRKTLLGNGVEIYEVRPDAEIPGTELVNASGARATLHTKAFIVDREQTFIGSFNFDPRSANINTEIGVLIEDPELATTLAERSDEMLPVQAYEVALAEGRQLSWTARREGESYTVHSEPQTTVAQRIVAGVTRALPIRSQL